MKVPVLNIAGEEVNTVHLPASVFDTEVNRALMHQALVRQLANARLGTHKVKGRSEVNRTTRKAYRQKGTGNARHGSRRAPIFVGGGVAHGPKQRKYIKRMPRKMRRAAICSALSAKASNGDIIVLDNFQMESAKTREMVAIVDRLVNDMSALILLPEHNENVERSARNLPDVKTLRANYLNIRDLLGYDKIVMPMAALDLVTGFLASNHDIIIAEDLVDSEEE